MAGVERPGTDLEQQRRHQKEIVAADEKDLDIRASFTKPFQMPGRVDSAKAAAQDHDPFLRPRSAHVAFQSAEPVCPFMAPLQSLPVATAGRSLRASVRTLVEPVRHRSVAASLSWSPRAQPLSPPVRPNNPLRHTATV